MNDQTELEKCIKNCARGLQLPPDGKVSEEDAKDMGSISGVNDRKASIDILKIFALEQGLSLDSMPVFQGMVSDARKFYDATVLAFASYASSGTCVRSDCDMGQFGVKNPAGRYSLMIADHSGSNFAYRFKGVQTLADAFDFQTDALKDTKKLFLTSTLKELESAEDGAGLYWVEENKIWGPTDKPLEIWKGLRQMAYAANAGSFDDKLKNEYLPKIKKELDRIYKL